MILDRISFRRKPPSTSHLSVLDLPVAEYDKITGLPASIQVGGRSVRPFISVQEVRDHLTLLSAFHTLATRSGQRFHRIMDGAAFDYERWASTVLALRARRKRSSSSDNVVTLPSAMQPPSSLPGSLPMSRAGTWSPPESPVSEVSSAESSTAGPTSPISLSPYAPLSHAELPPLPVLMCWHAHLLNPGQFAIDSEGTYAWLAAIPFPLEAAAEAIRTQTLPTEIQHVSLSAYTADLRPVPSISGWTPPDIAAAVQRLARRTATLSQMGWLDEAYIRGDAAPFQRGIVRYHAWLDLIAASHTFVAPTFDIMLSWATHQLHGARYRRDTARVLGKLQGEQGEEEEEEDEKDQDEGDPLDRPIDRTEQDHDSLKRAAALWKSRFRQEYIDRRAVRAPVRRSTV